MAFDIWKTLYTNDFKGNRFLYHYCSFDKAIKIIQSNSLQFAPINKTNDTVEAKVRLAFLPPAKSSVTDYEAKTNAIYDYFRNHHPEVKLVCFSTDSPSMNSATVSNIYSLEKSKYYDVSGRGFALPRMWSQYADNNQGVCFIFNKEKLIREVEKSVSLFKKGNVQYKKITDRFNLDETTVENLYAQVTMPANGNLTLVQMMNNKEFMQYCYFQKLDDWKGEREYRIVALTGSDDTLRIMNLPSYLEGIVIGENMDQAYEKVIKLLVGQYEAKIEVKKICFSGQICKLK